MDATPLLARTFLALSALVNVPATAAVLYAQTRVSDAGLTGNSIAEGNTSRNLAVGANGTIYAVFRGPSGIRVAASDDRGQSFAPSVEVSATDAEAEIAVSSTGIVYVAWFDGTLAQVSRSLDGGASFAAPVAAGAVNGTVHMGTDASHVYLVDRTGSNFYRSEDNGLTFALVTLTGLPQVYSDVLVAPDSGDVYVQVDDPGVKYYVSTDQGATFSAITFPVPGGDIYYSVGALSIGPHGRYIITSGVGSDALRIDLDANTSQLLTFGANTPSQGRSLVADRCGNVVDGYVNGTDLQFHVSNDLGDTFGAATTVATVADAADQNANVFIDQTSGNVLFLSTQGGEVFLSVYQGELPCYAPELSTSAVVFSAQLLGTTSAAQVVHLTNTGASEIQITDVTVTGEFSHSTECVGALAVGASCDVSVTFSPTAAGTRIGQIEIGSSVFPVPRTVQLSGLGVLTAPVPQFSPSPQDFGERAVDTTSEATVTLRNAGNEDLTINEFNITGAFAFTSGCPATLAPDESCDLQISFSPDALAEFSGTLTLDSSAPGAPATLALSGMGAVGYDITAMAPASGGTISPVSVTVTAGETPSFTVTPAEGYVILAVTGCDGTLEGSTYTVAAVTEDCTVEAQFTLDTVVVSARGKGGGGSMSLLMLSGLLLAVLLRCARALHPAIAVLAGLPLVAQAGDLDRWYAGASIGSARTDKTSSQMNRELDRLGYDVSASIDDRSRTAWQAYGGFRWSRHFALQGGYTDLGTVHTSFEGDAVDLAQFLQDANLIQPRSASGLDLKLVASYPVGERLSLVAQLGGFRWKADLRVTNDSGELARRDDDGFDATYGAGLEVGVTQHAALSAGWSRYEVGDESIDLFAAGLQYRWH